MYLQRCVTIIIVDLTFGIFHTLAHFDEKFIDIVLEEFSCFFVTGICHFVFFHIDEDKSDMLNDCENQMFASIIPVFCHFISKIKLSGVRVDHGMVDLTDKEDLRRFPREIFESYLEL